MRWPPIEETNKLIPLPDGYTFVRLSEILVRDLAGRIQDWHPDISVGAGSCFQREDFYRDKVVLSEHSEKDILVLLIMTADSIVGLMALERDPDALTMFGKLIIVSPNHRNSKVALHALAGGEAFARASGAEFSYCMATLKTPHVQAALERAGYKLLGFTPGYDRETVSDGQVKRVFEAVYAKLLVEEGNVLLPRPENMTPTARALFEHTFPEHAASGAA